jgi:AraC-like DNA-binding protein
MRMVIKFEVNLLPDVNFFRDPNLPYFELKSCDADQLAYKKHFHEEYSFGAVDQGLSHFWCEGQLTDIVPGNLIWIPPYRLHACNPHQANHWKYRMLFFHPRWIEDLCAFAEKKELLNPLIRRSSERPRRDQVGAIITCLTGSASPLEKETVIWTALSDGLGLNVETVGCHHQVAKERLKLREIRGYLHDHFRERITLDELGQVSGLNKFYLVHLFKLAYQVPPHTYQTLLRVNFAKQELGKQRAIADVALEAGFYDQSHFSKVFKAHVGATPEQYQRP